MQKKHKERQENIEGKKNHMGKKQKQSKGESIWRQRDGKRGNKGEKCFLQNLPSHNSFMRWILVCKAVI